MNLSTLIVLAVIVAAVVVVLFRLHRNRRKGKSCCGCALGNYCHKKD